MVMPDKPSWKYHPLRCTKAGSHRAEGARTSDFAINGLCSTCILWRNYQHKLPHAPFQEAFHTNVSPKSRFRQWPRYAPANCNAILGKVLITGCKVGWNEYFKKLQIGHPLEINEVLLLSYQKMLGQIINWIVRKDDPMRVNFSCISNNFCWKLQQ